MSTTIRRAARVLCVPTLFLCASCMSIPRPLPEVSSPAMSLDTTSHSQLEVQALVMKLADEYMSALAEATDPALAAADSACDRRIIAGMRQRGTMSAMDIASGPNPSASLLDLLVLS